MKKIMVRARVVQEPNLSISRGLKQVKPGEH